MKQYIYTAAEVGFSEWPSGTLRLEGIEITEDPKQADIFICPGSLSLFQNPHDLDRLPYIEGNEHRTVFFDCSDFDTIYTRKNPILIRCNLKRFMQEAHPNSIAWAWPVADLGEIAEIPRGGFKHQVSFHGWLSTSTRSESVQSCLNFPLLQCDFATYKDFYGYIENTDEGRRRRREFLRSLQESRIVLCPESIPGVFPYRFFEAMSAGRVPALIASDMVFPFADEIPYSDFIIKMERHEAHCAGQVIARYLKENDDATLIEKGKQARAYWLKYLHQDWPKSMAYAIKKRLACA